MVGEEQGPGGKAGGAGPHDGFRQGEDRRGQAKRPVGRTQARGVTEEEIAQLSAVLEGYEPAYTNFQAMSLSVKKTYTRAYLDAKTEAGREKRIAWMVDRLNRNLKPM